MMCRHRACARPPKTRGYCESHYRRLLRMGHYGTVDAKSTQDHVVALRALGWTYEQIGEVAGVSMRQAWDLEHRLFTRVRKITQYRILSVPLEPVSSRRGTDPTGTMRRLRALQRMGWPGPVIAERLGVKVGTIYTVCLRGGGHGRVSFAFAAKVRALYDEISHLPGPSKAAAVKARNRGYPSPMAWDDDTIDDPAAAPCVDGPEQHRADVVREEYRHLKGLLSDHEIARRLGITPQTLRDYVKYRKRGAA